MKEDIRKKIIKLRKSILNKKEISTIIVDKIKALDIYQKANVIAIYHSMKEEVDTSSFFKDDKIFLLPRVVGNDLVFVKISSNTKYSKSKFGVIEPIIDENAYDGVIDLIIVPGVSFDKEFNRLGYGKGYYDCFLRDKDIYKIGVCFDKVLVDRIPIENHDIKMDLVITEKKIIKKV